MGKEDEWERGRDRRLALRTLSGRSLTSVEWKTFAALVSEWGCVGGEPRASSERVKAESSGVSWELACCTEEELRLPPSVCTYLYRESQLTFEVHHIGATSWWYDGWIGIIEASDEVPGAG